MSVYKTGARKEYAIRNKLLKEGYDIVVRSAGSHSPIDIIAIKTSTREILFVQSKRTIGMPVFYVNPNLKEKLESEYVMLNNTFNCSFVVM